MQNVLAEASINSIMRLVSSVMAESGLMGRFWFKAVEAGANKWNVIFKEL
jgi:hypothetical protein